MTKPRDARVLLWSLLCFWLGVELLYSSRWWPPSSPSVSTSPSVPSLRSFLAGSPTGRIWFAPYLPFPEPGFVESTARRGFYDTLLALPLNTGLVTNYGASKLSAADTLFTWASVHGLSAELRLAQQLGYGFFALDLGALTDPQAGLRLCRRTSGCRLSSDAYALFPIRDGGALGRGLAGLQRRIPLLPWQGESNGLSWGPLVFNQFQWGPVAIPAAGSLDGLTPFLLPARPTSVLEIYRHPISQYPDSVQPWLRLDSSDVQLVLPAEVLAARVCIGPKKRPCRVLMLGPDRRRVPIGDLLQEGVLTEFIIQELRWQRSGSVPLMLELRLPQAAQAMNLPS